LTQTEPLVLACDTSAARGSVALARRGALLATVILEGEGGHSRRFLSAVERALRDAGVDLGDVDRFAAVSGPGSFTGLRVSLAAVRGLAGPRPCAGAVAPDVAALAALRAGFGGGPILALTDLFHDEVFGGLYDAAGRLSPGTERVAGKIEAVLARLAPPQDAVVIGSGAVRHADVLRSSLAIARFPPDPASFDLASPLAIEASARPGGLSWTASGDLTPFYLRDPLTRALPPAS
jgi:tRNA threonylcarbamoyladenosine biosynthesis protein TsaB